MLLLTKPDQELVLEVVSASDVDVYAFYHDFQSPSLAQPVPGSFGARLTAPGMVALQATALGAAAMRQYTAVYVVNKHLSAATDLYFKVRDGANYFRIKRYNLGVNEHVDYIHGRGFTLYDVDGVPQVPV